MRECFLGHLSLAAQGPQHGPHETAAKCTVKTEHTHTHTLTRAHTHTHTHAHQSPAKAAAKSPAKKAAPAKKATPVKKPKPVVIMDKKPKVPTFAARPARTVNRLPQCSVLGSRLFVLGKRPALSC